jgi:signal transduction histidine kinase
MKFTAIESRARIGIAALLIALLLAVGIGLFSYLKAAGDLSKGRIEQLKLQAVLLASLVSSDASAETDAKLKEHLKQFGLTVACVVYSPDGAATARASTAEPEPEWRLLTPSFGAGTIPGLGNLASGPQPSLSQASARAEGELQIAESRAPDGRIVVVAQTAEAAPLPTIYYIFSYQLIALVLGLCIVALLVRWVLRPYRRMVEAARGSPVTASREMSESEFVVETFQALIDQLQLKERELAELHALERRRAERSERFSERLIANIPSGLVVITPGGLVSSANAYARQIFASAGHDGDKPRAGGGLQTVSVDYRAFFRGAPRMIRLVSECLANGTAFQREEVEVSGADSRMRRLGLSLSPITDAQQGIEGALCLLTDITEVSELRERMKVQESMANLGEMAAGLAHEFKNSLATIHGYVQLLEFKDTDRADHDGRSRALEAMLGEVRLLAQLVTDFLNFARPQQPVLSPVEIRTVIEDCTAELRPQLARGSIELRVEGQFATLPGDESMLKRAFSNLLRNAAEAIDSCSANSLIEVTSLLDTGKGRRYAHIRISDTGGGIPAENLQKIFIPFFTTKSRGYGIGLALVQKIFVAHGGDVSVERSDQSGTVFHCRLPMSSPPSQVEHTTESLSLSVT